MIKMATDNRPRKCGFKWSSTLKTMDLNKTELKGPRVHAHITGDSGEGVIVASKSLLLVQL